MKKLDPYQTAALGAVWARPAIFAQISQKFGTALIFYIHKILAYPRFTKYKLHQVTLKFNKYALLSDSPSTNANLNR